MIRNFLLIGLIFLVSCSDRIQLPSKVIPSLLPKPQKITVLQGELKLETSISIYFDQEFKIAQDFISGYLNPVGIKLTPTSRENALWLVEKDTLIPSEGYSLNITEEYIEIRARDAGGAFYAMQTIRQLLPAAFEEGTAINQTPISLPLLRIEDAPKFPYRGMHLDVGRHFFKKEFIKKYIGYLAMLKMNYFHWHLTEDQGWRIEIKKYPKLTSHAAYREETLKGHYNKTPQEFDGQRYGGFYTQEDIKEIVAYAQSLNITIIPEIEMPGHAQAAISAYPELGCTGLPVPVATKWGVFEEVYCPKEETFNFLKNVLSEVTALFPGPYIHIGGDEAPKSHWENCSHCQSLIKKLGLENEHELQSYFITRIEAFLNEKGKKIIGWDEILEGGLAPNATVMSWRGTQGGIEAAKEKHPVIMTPTSYCYFDYYQSEDPDEPLAIGGFLPLEKVYGFNPIPEGLSEEASSYILGAQGNVWTEYMPSEKQVEYMVFPRILALSEVVWTGPTKDPENSYSEFASRVENYHQRLDALGINYANHLYKLNSLIKNKEGDILYELQTHSKNKEIVFQLNQGQKQTYSKPITIDKTSVISAQVYSNGNPLGGILKDSIVFHKGITGAVNLNPNPHSNYASGGKEALINGRLGSNTRYGDSEWLGFWGDDVTVTVDLIKETEIKKIKLRFFNAPGQWIYHPKEVLLYSSNDQTNFTLTSQITLESATSLTEGVFIFNDLKTRYIRLEIPNYGIIPAGQQGAGNKAWTFIDEIIIE